MIVLCSPIFDDYGQCSSDFFRAFLEAITNIEVASYENLQQYRNDITAATSELDPLSAVQYAQQQLAVFNPDENLLSLYNAIRDFLDAAYGEGFRFENDHELVVATYNTAIRLSGKQKVPLPFATTLADLLRNALSERASVDYLNQFIQQKGPEVSNYRIRKLEEAASNLGAPDVAIITEQSIAIDRHSPHEFTLAQQALAIHYLVYEALRVTSIDTTKLIALAHLLGAKKIPQKGGKDNLDNSGIKSAFRNMWQKEDKNHLADLTFVLRYLKPLESAGAEGISNAIKAIERRIEKVSEKLSRHKD